MKHFGRNEEHNLPSSLWRKSGPATPEFWTSGFQTERIIFIVLRKACWKNKIYWWNLETRSLRWRKNKNACCHYFYSILLQGVLTNSGKQDHRGENSQTALFLESMGGGGRKCHKNHNSSLCLVSWGSMLPFFKFVCSTRISKNPEGWSSLSLAFPFIFASLLCFIECFPPGSPKSDSGSPD